MNKAYVLVMFIVIVNLVLAFFGTLGFFSYQPEGVDIAYNSTEYGFDNLLTDGFIATGLALLGLVISAFVRINAFAMIMFIEIFWFPYLKCLGFFHEVLQYTPEAFEIGIYGIFTTIMLFIFAYALLEMSSNTVVSG